MVKNIFQKQKESGNAFLDVIFTVFFFLLALAMIFKYDYVASALKELFSQGS